MTDRCLSIDNNLPPKRAYSRTKSTARTDLENAIVLTHQLPNIKNPSCAILPSGMAAISAVFYAFFSKEKNAELLLSDELYCDTPNCATAWRKDYNFKLITFDVCNSEWLLEHCKKTQGPVLMFLESCSNPSGKMLDWRIIPELKKLNPNLVVCVDNTWLTSVLFNPFKYDVDIVLESLTKYRSGGKIIGGFVCGQAKFIETVKRYITLHGMFVGADHCEIFTKAQATLQQRVEKASLLAQEIINSLDSVSTVTVVSPSQVNHASYKVYSQFVAKPTSPAVFLIHIESNCSLNDIEGAKYPRGLLKETSYGSEYSKIDPWPHLGSNNDYFETKKEKKSGVWLRISVGYNDTFTNLSRNLQIVIENFYNT